MKKVYKIFSVLFYFLIFILLLSSFTSTVLKRPFLFATIRSNSMYPLYEKGDLALIWPAKKSSYKHGDIIVFEGINESSQKNLIMHRIINGDKNNGFITKGDANELADQDQGLKPVKLDSIYSKAILINNKPIKLPIIGFITLWAENLDVQPTFFPFINLLLIVAIVVFDIIKKPKKHTNPKLGTALLCFAVGLSLSILLGTTMLSGSQHMVISYQVSETSKGALMGSSIGIIKKGDKITDKNISTISNKGVFPLLVSVTCNDKQISFNYDKLILKPGDEINLNMDIYADTPGNYRTSIWVGMFIPLLPLNFIHFLAKINFWLALSIISLIPNLPIMLYPVINGKLRIAMAKEIRRKIRRFRKRLSVKAAGL